MKYRYSKFEGFDVSSINLGELMDSMSDALLDSGYDDDYYWTRQRKTTDTSLDALRRALLQPLLDQGLVSEKQLRDMLAENEGKFQGSLLEQLLNLLIFFFFNDTATTEIYTLSLHDALPAIRRGV